MVIEEYSKRINRTMDHVHPIIKSFVAGSFSGTCSTILFQPLDLVKTRIQTQQAGSSPGGLFQVFRLVIKNDKLQGLWRGVVPSLTRTVPGIGVYFCSLHTLRTNFGSADPHPLESMAIGMFARTVSGASVLPVTVVKARFESGKFCYAGMIDALKTISRVEGWRGLFCGLSPTLLRDAPFSGLYLMFYTQAKKYVKSVGYPESNTPLVHFSCGVISGCLASIVTQPADVIKTQMQVNSSQFHSFQQTVRHVYKHEGVQGFLRGVVPRTLRRTLMAAMAWTVYEQVMKTCRVK